MFAWRPILDLISVNQVIVYADFIDPFCYIGFHNLRAVADPLQLTLEWRGFELNPGTPPEGFALQTAGNSDLRGGMWASVKEYASKAGLAFSQPQQVPNTRLAHGLVRRIKKSHVKNPLIERIYQAYFNENKDIGAVPVLVALAKEFGISEEVVKQELSPAVLGEKLEHMREEAKAREFPGMPGFVFRGQPFFGALSQAAWQPILSRKITTKEKNN
jgi:predicted DsbA family dithiol-disulfide isomerase